MRRLWVVLVLAAAGCAVRPETVPGAAAPLTATSPAPQFSTLTMSGSGVTVAVPVPAGWTRKASTTAGITRTDVDLVDPQVLLRIDLSARGPGSARDGAVRTERSADLAAYHRLDITPVPDVGDDAVDWTFTFDRDGTRRVVDRQVLSGPAVVAVYFSAPQELYQRYLPVWQHAVEALSITTS
ncbi:MAG TPA: hypothetical protein VLM05_12845 [Mycobacteriales bacterium]|nr:hypothetical protein [Mycobacteriales bacterium]